MRLSVLAVFSLSLVTAFDAVDDEQRILGLQTAEPPAPTAPPEPWLVKWKLEPRANEGTCGFINGNAANPVTCSPGYVCAHNTANSVFGCCSGNLNTCTLPTVCFDSSIAQALSVSVDGFTQVCGRAAAPYCTTYVAASGYAFGCGSQAGQLVLVYNSGTSAGGGGSAVVAGGITTGFQPTGSGAAAATNGGFTASGSGSAATATAAVAGGGTSSGNTSGGTSNSSSGGGSALSTGAIVAIAVCGGVVVLALIILIAFLVHRRGKRKDAQRQAAAANYQQVPPGPPAGPPPGPQRPMTYDGSTQVGTASNVGSGLPMTQANMNAMYPNQAGEWDFTKNAVHQPQGAATHDADGIKVTEISPEEAVDERAQQEMKSQIGSNVAPTAVAPTMISHHVQGV